MTSQSSGGSGSGLPGVITDGKTPGGEVIAGALTAGDPNAASVPSTHHINGLVLLSDAPGNCADGDQVLVLSQGEGLVDSFTPQGALLQRSGALNGHDYGEAFVEVSDSTASSQPPLKVVKQGATQFQVDGDGVQVHGKFKVGSAVTHTLGAYSGKSLPIYDETGTLVGYAPCYA